MGDANESKGAMKDQWAWSQAGSYLNSEVWKIRGSLTQNMCLQAPEIPTIRITHSPTRGPLNHPGSLEDTAAASR